MGDQTKGHEANEIKEGGIRVRTTSRIQMIKMYARSILCVGEKSTINHLKVVTCILETNCETNYTDGNSKQPQFYTTTNH